MNLMRPMAYATYDQTDIRPSFQLRFERISSDPRRGLCLIDVSLKNMGAIVANFPFFCLTAFGLHIYPAIGWSMCEVTSVRKMQRFVPIKDVELKPQDESVCCTIALPYKSYFGGSFEFERGNERLLSEMPNLNLVCTVGAGNYPSKRIVLQVPASALRAMVATQEIFTKSASSARETRGIDVPNNFSDLVDTKSSGAI